MSFILALFILGLGQQIICSTEGIDISVWQGTIDWGRVKQEKQFSFIRATFGVSEDSKFAENWPNAKAAGMPVGPYHFFEPGDDPTAQAENFCRVVGTLQQIPPTVDCEVMGDLSPADYQAKVLVWLKYVENHFGVKPMIYTGVYHGNTYFNTQEMAQYPLWIANWGVDRPGIPGKWTTYAYWQYADNGSVSGISGRVDLDRKP